MKVPAAVAEILKREGVEFIFGYPVNPILEAAAAAGIRPVLSRQERIGLHMADAMSRLTAGRRMGVFVMQNGPGAENAFGAVAQAYADSVPVLVMPMGYGRRQANVAPNFSALLNYQHITKACEQVTVAAAVPDALRRAFSQLRNGRPGPVMVEIPADLAGEDVAEPLDYVPVSTARPAPDPAGVAAAARVLVAAERPVIYAGQGVLYAEAWDALRALAELLEAPVTTSLQAKSAFPEDHPLALGSGGRALPGPVHEFIRDADVILGIGCSFSRTGFGIAMPPGKTYIHATLDPADLNKDVRADYAIVGDARLTLEALTAAVGERITGKPRGRAGAVSARIRASHDAWYAKWAPKLRSEEVPLNPYRILTDLMATVNRDETIITHDAGSPRDQLSPFWQATRPRSYIGWGKSTQLGYGLGLALGPKLTHPEKLCINVWGDAAIGMTGMDFETAVRERIPILSLLFNNFSMAIELPIMPVATERYRSTDISGNYAELAKALGGYGERVTRPEEIVPAIRRGMEQTQQGRPALLEFLTAKEISYSIFS